jgi:hypothetical protein
MIGKKEAQKILDQLNSDIEWILLDLDEETGRALVISRDCVTQRAYHRPEPVTWETSILREWLNSDFYNSLPEDVRARVIETEIVNKNNCSIPGGNNTKDFVFLLSIDEFNELLPEDLRPSRFRGSANWWWLRSPGYSTGDVSDVYPDGGLDGGINAHGFYAFCERGGVRPALYLNLQ